MAEGKKRREIFSEKGAGEEEWGGGALKRDEKGGRKEGKERFNFLKQHCNVVTTEVFCYSNTSVTKCSNLRGGYLLELEKHRAKSSQLQSLIFLMKISSARVELWGFVYKEASSLPQFEYVPDIITAGQEI